jgi:hypothetical protein
MVIAWVQVNFQGKNFVTNDGSYCLTRTIAQFTIATFQKQDGAIG